MLLHEELINKLETLKKDTIEYEKLKDELEDSIEKLIIKMNFLFNKIEREKNKQEINIKSNEELNKNMKQK